MLATRERFTSCCQRLGAQDNPKRGRTIDGTYDELLAAYTAPDRHYHNLGHINDGLEKLDEVRHLLEDPDAVEMAWWWHDFVYNTASRTNEYESALAADLILFELGVKTARRNKMVWLIMPTKHDRIPTGNDQRYMVDIDLASLGTVPEVFDQNTANIRKEYAWVPDDDFRTGRADFFRKMLEGRPSGVIYLTDYFRERYEAQAQENLKRIIS